MGGLKIEGPLYYHYELKVWFISHTYEPCAGSCPVAEWLRALGRVTYMPQSSGFETSHRLMPMKYLSLCQKEKMHV